MKRAHLQLRRFRRRGVIAVQVAVLMVAIAGFAALTIDVGRIYSAKADLQRAADAAALAGASSYVSDAGLTQNTDMLNGMISGRSTTYSATNPTLHKSTQLELADLKIGYHDFALPDANLAGGFRWNAVEVTVRRTTGGANGAVPLFFAKVFGYHEANVTATARAAADDRVAGYRVVEGGGFIPFTLHEAIYDDRFTYGPDEYSYEEDYDNVKTFGDGIPEIVLFPWKWSSEDTELDTLNWPNGDTSQSDAAGNFGTLNVGIDNQASVGLEYQIRNGITVDEMEDEFGTTELIFHDENGSHTFTSTGNPGLSTTLRFALEERIGDVVGYFVHKQSLDTGSTSEFQISGVRFARIMAVKLTGPPKNRALVLQPVAVNSDYFIISEWGPSSGGQMVRLQLVR